MKKVALSLISAAALLACVSACDPIVDGDPCSIPGKSICDFDDVYECDAYYEYHRVESCGLHEVCREDRGFAACYSTCSESQVGLENYVCVGDEIQIERCTRMNGYSTPVWVYERAKTLCTDDYSYFYCSGSRRIDTQCPGYGSRCLPDAFVSPTGAWEAGCR